MSKFSNDSEFVCPIFASSQKCDQDALQVMEQFKDFYEEKLGEVDTQGGGDCLEMKLKIQRRWIEDLTEQTQMMARIVKELEDEATARVRMLEDKLKQTSKSAYEVMKRYQAYSISHNLDEPFQRVFYLENDMKNVLEFLRRVRDDKMWSIEGLQFYDITCKDLFGGKDSDYDQSRSSVNSNGLCPNKQEAPSSEDPGKPENVDHSETQDHVRGLLKKKDEEYEDLRRSMLDMRTALTEEVACKHDMISSLRKDVQQLEERCLQSDKQTAFKDDIIKELRKEIKQVKQQMVHSIAPRRSKHYENKTVYRTVNHCECVESPRVSTVIFIKEKKEDNVVKVASKNRPEEVKKIKPELSKSETDLLNAYYSKEIPVKEKSKFTVTNFNNGLEKVYHQGLNKARTNFYDDNY